MRTNSDNEALPTLRSESHYAASVFCLHRAATTLIALVLAKCQSLIAFCCFCTLQVTVVVVKVFVFCLQFLLPHFFGHMPGTAAAAVAAAAVAAAAFFAPHKIKASFK